MSLTSDLRGAEVPCPNIPWRDRRDYESCTDTALVCGPIEDLHHLLHIMASFLDDAYSLVHQDNVADQPSQQDLKTQLEKGTDDSKVETMKRILTIMLNGDPMPNLLMHIIRFVMPSKGKNLKKLLYFYYEICPKLDANGKLKQEMILVWYVQSVCSISWF